MENRTKQSVIFAAFIALITWFALVLQFYLLIFIVENGLSKGEKIVQYFSFFTILNNLLVATCFTVTAIKPLSKWGIYFSKSTVLTAITVYITFVGISYNLLLRHIWSPQGWHKVADEELHTFIPIICIIYWCIFVSAHKLQWKDFLLWMIYPLIYLAYMLVRGAYSGLYPYYFVNASVLGYPAALFNSLVLIIAFIILSLGYIAISKIRSRRISEI